MRVRILYKTILKLHCGLPQELKILGTNYVREEFKRHKKCNIQETKVFMKEWTNYAITLAEQLGLRGPQTGSPLGVNLSKNDLEKFKDDQICQLYELLEAAKSDKN
ncbi:succinate dehydrogenase assembly factor 3, mitochondrial isoform X2 [Tribolium madens]|uniref:succinate dehydrogenase assembly factor 3, mitochondrial isoform X2 n=1 Tax=Tribolium madens TaxID=41895 RepID=UPI001CF72997|nr:succinate dehydrogenase assembly factor 3, mitochondrial isoform X2 [Tribolium madens]